MSKDINNILFLQVVDTPGFGDSDDEEEILIEEMMDTLANVIDHAGTILLTLDGRITRFSDGLTTMLKRMTIIFGQNWWDYVVIGVSFWAYDQDSIDDRECYPGQPQDRCRDDQQCIARETKHGSRLQVRFH